MKSSQQAQSTTSLPRAPRDESGSRSTRYLVMMGVRVLCFLLMVVVQPYGWYTWAFGAGAILLPYVAVVLANVGQESNDPPVETPERAIASGTAIPAAPEAPAVVIRLSERTSAPESTAQTAPPRAGDAQR